MTWEVFIHTHSGHFKYWSAQKDSSGYTGIIKYGRIGSSGRNHNYGDANSVGLKIREKMNEGYTIFNPQHTSGIPLTAEVNRFIGREREPEPEPEPEPTPVQRVRTRMSNPRVNKYETNRQGYLKKVREGYERPSVSKDYKIVGKPQIGSSVALLNKTKRFWESIPSSQLAKKRPFGSDFDSQEIFGRYTGAFFFVIDEEGKPIAVYERFGRQAKVDTFYIKTNQTDYIYVMKYILGRLGRFYSDTTSDTNLQIKVKGATLITSLREVFTGASVTSSQGVSTFKIPMSSLTSLQTTVVIKRWSE